jgi:hypothetical protein
MAMSQEEYERKKAKEAYDAKIAQRLAEERSLVRGISSVRHRTKTYEDAYKAERPPLPQSQQLDIPKLDADLPLNLVGMLQRTEDDTKTLESHIQYIELRSNKPQYTSSEMGMLRLNINYMLNRINNVIRASDRFFNINITRSQNPNFEKSYDEQTRKTIDNVLLKLATSREKLKEMYQKFEAATARITYTPQSIISAGGLVPDRPVPRNLPTIVEDSQVVAQPEQKQQEEKEEPTAAEPTALEEPEQEAPKFEFKTPEPEFKTPEPEFKTPEPDSGEQITIETSAGPVKVQALSDSPASAVPEIAMGGTVINPLSDTAHIALGNIRLPRSRLTWGERTVETQEEKEEKQAREEEKKRSDEQKYKNLEREQNFKRNRAPAEAERKQRLANNPIAAPEVGPRIASPRGSSTQIITSGDISRNDAIAQDNDRFRNRLIAAAAARYGIGQLYNAISRFLGDVNDGVQAASERITRSVKSGVADLGEKVRDIDSAVNTGARVTRAVTRRTSKFKCAILDILAFIAIYNIDSIAMDSTKKESFIAALYYAVIRRASVEIRNYRENLDECQSYIFADAIASVAMNKELSKSPPEFAPTRTLEYGLVSLALNVIDHYTNFTRLIERVRAGADPVVASD